MLSLFSHFGASADRRVLTSRFARPYCFVLVANFPCFQSCQPRFPPVSSLFISLLLRNPQGDFEAVEKIKINPKALTKN